MQKAVIEAALRRREYLLALRGSDENPVDVPELTITMHPRVFADMRMTLEGSQTVWLTWRDGHYYLMDMRVIEDTHVDGIEMIVR